jgi:hypothetical protein
MCGWKLVGGEEVRPMRSQPPGLQDWQCMWMDPSLACNTRHAHSDAHVSLGYGTASRQHSECHPAQFGLQEQHRRQVGGACEAAGGGNRTGGRSNSMYNVHPI